MRWKNFLLRPASSLCIGVLGCKKSLVRRDVQRGLGSESHHRFQRETGHMLNPFMLRLFQPPTTSDQPQHGNTVPHIQLPANVQLPPSRLSPLCYPKERSTASDQE